MVQYHGAEAAQRFLLTVMNMVRISNKVFTQVLVSAPQSRLCLLHIELPFTQSVHTQVSSLNPLAAPCSLFLSSYGLISDAGPAVWVHSDPLSRLLQSIGLCSSREYYWSFALLHINPLNFSFILATFVLKNALGTMNPCLVSVINTSLSSGRVPANFKHAVVQPLLKKVNLDPSVPNNYRPSSKLPLISKNVWKSCCQTAQCGVDWSYFSQIPIWFLSGVLHRNRTCHSLQWHCDVLWCGWMLFLGAAWPQCCFPPCRS